jgi:hypothetical protein
VPPCNLFLPSQSTGTTPWRHVVRIRSRNQGCLCTTARSRQPVLHGEFHAQITQRPVDTKSSVAWELRLAVKNGTTQPWCAQVTRVPRPSVPRIPRTQLKEKSSTQGRATYLQFLPAWLAGLLQQQAMFQGLGSHCDLTAKSFMIGQTT